MSLQTRTQRSAASLVALVLAAIVLMAWRSGARAEPETRVYLNGVPTPVYFNDGDSFRVLSGPLTGNKARLEGFNTLESFGPAHQWGTWNAWELYVNAKMATLNGRRGIWHCTSDMDRDGYGRTLWVCPDLAVDNISKGLAHVYSVDDNPGRIEYIRAQRRAIAQRRGMWAHGVPQFIVTSIHSANENPERDFAYNRMISVRDGHSDSMKHTQNYAECQMVCMTEKRVDYDRVDAVAAQLRENGELADAIKNTAATTPPRQPAPESHGDPVPAVASLDLIDNLHLSNATAFYLRHDTLPEWVPPNAIAPLTRALAAAKASGALGVVTEAPSSCMLNVGFMRRYGLSRASCLRH
jgi:endonuclease YncB( thermonuclease family)